MINKIADATIIICVLLGGTFLAVGLYSMFENQPPKYFKDTKYIDELKDDENIELSWVSSTEYTLPKDHNGSSIIRLRDSKNNFVYTNCWITILYPDRTEYLPTTPMAIDSTYGEYYLHWEVPDTKLGVYSQEAKCSVKNANVTQSKTFHVSNMTNVILNSNHNLNQSIQKVLETLNCSNPDYTEMCDRLNNINSNVLSLTNYSTIILSSNLSTITNAVININDTLSDSTKIYYSISAPSCIVGSKWIFSFNATNEEFENLRYLDCQLTTSRFGTEIVNFNISINQYQKIHDCDNPEELLTWELICQRT
jgi:hypothetical protein